MSNNPALQTINEFKQIVDEVYGLYLDSTQGFLNNIKSHDQSRANSINSIDLTNEELDNRRMIYGKGNPNLPTSYILHVCSQGEYRKRNQKGEKNYTILGHVCVTQIYSYWEDYYRGQIANSLEMSKSGIISEIFGDLRILRHSILHHRAIALPDISKCKTIKWFSKGDYIKLEESHIEEIFFMVKSEIDRLEKIYCH